MNPNENPEDVIVPAINPEDPEANEDPTDPKKKPSQDPAKPEPKKPLSKRERLEFQKNKIEQQLNDLDEDEDDNRPVTMGDLKKMQRDQSRTSSIELAQSIADEDERTQVIDILQNRIVPSGDPQKDLELAQGAVNTIRTAQIAQEQARKQNPSGTHTPSAPGPKAGDVFEPTAEELTFMKPPYNLTKEEVIAARNKDKNG